MANTTTRTAARTLTALTLTASLGALTATPAAAQTSTRYNNTPMFTTTQSGDWETLSNLPMVDALAVPPYGWRNGFRIRVGARWDSGLFYGAPWGNIEGRTQLWVDSPAGPATVRATPALVAVNVVPAFNDQYRGGYWYDACQAAAGGWNNPEPVAYLSSPWCAAPTVGGPYSNYRMGGYAACIHVVGQAFVDIPSSWFDVSVCPKPAQRL